jgi:integrase
LTLAEARTKAEAQNKMVAQGFHLTVVKHTEKVQRQVDSANTFKAVAAAWVKREQKPERSGWSPSYLAEVEMSLRNHLGPINRLPVHKITPAIVAPIMTGMEDTAPHMIEKVRRRLRAIMDFAVEKGMIPVNPIPVVVRRRNLERKKYPAVTDLPGLGAILRAARAADPCKGIARAHLLLAFTALRVSEVVGSAWAEFELDGVDVQIGDTQSTKRDPGAGNWSIPRERMKRKDEDRGPHVIPLPRRLLAMLRTWREADGPDAVYVCPAPRDPSCPVTPEGCEKFYRNALGLARRHSPHSWRSAFSSVCNDHGKDERAIESQLDHVVGNKVANRYDRAKRLELRRELLQWYEDQLIAARDGAEVVQIGQASAAA